MTKGMITGLALMMALAAGVTGLEAQGRPGGAGGRGGPGGMGGGMMMGDLGRTLEVALANGQALELTDEQVAGLEALKVEVDRDAEPFRREMQGMRGGGERGADREAMQAVMQRMTAALAPHRARFEQITTEEQRTRLQPLMRRGPGERRGPGGPPR
jgi:hypothetical protein